MAETTQLDILSTDPEVLGLQRQRQLANLLTGQAFNQPQGQMISGHYVAPSALQQALPMINAAIGGLTNANLDTKQQELATALRQQKGEAINKFQTLMSNPDTRGQAMQFAASNQYLQPLATELMKPQMFKKGDVFAMPSISGGAPIELGRGMAELPSELESAQIALNLPANPKDWTDAQRQAASNYQLGLKNASAMRSYTNIQNQIPFKERIQAEAATGLMKNFETLQNIPATLQNMDKMIKLSQQPIFAGVGGESKLQIAKLLNNNFGTNISPDAVKNTEEFKAAAYMGIMDNLKKTDSNPTMAQQNALKEAIGSLGTDPSALPRVVNVMRDVLVNKAQQHNELVRQTMQKGVEYPYSIEVQLPKTNPTANTGLVGNIDTNSLDAILKARGALK